MHESHLACFIATNVSTNDSSKLESDKHLVHLKFHFYVVLPITAASFVLRFGTTTGVRRTRRRLNGWTNFHTLLAIAAF